MKMKKGIKRMLSLILALTMVITLCPSGQIFDVYAANEPYCISYGRAAYSSSDNGNSTAENVTDGKESTRWESIHGEDIQWLYVDLGKVADITGVNILWEAAYAKSYKIQVSNDEENWEDVYIKGNVTEPDDGEVEVQDIIIKYEFDSNGDISASWNTIDNATYKVCIGNDQTVAKAPDGYSFTSHAPSNGLIGLTNSGLTKGNTYELIVIALDSTGNEITRGTKSVYIPLDGEVVEEETTTAGEEESEEETDDWERITFTAQGRYVRIYMTERATAYGYSMYEFQVYGLNGVTQRPVDYGTNLALNKDAYSSGLKDVWWMYDEAGNLKPESVAEVVEANAVDGDGESSWESYQEDKQWFYVDLGQAYDIGRIILKWDEAGGKVYDIDVSADGQSWKTVYRRLNGYQELEENLPLYEENVRYVRMNGYTKIINGSGFSIRELEVYEYVEGDAKTTYSISELPQAEIKTVGKATYVSNDIYMEKAYLPSYIDEENIKAPIKSNDWWQSAMVKKFGNRMETMPFKTGYSKKGLSILTATEGWVPAYGETDVNISAVSEETADMYITPENLDVNTAYDRVHDYSDYSVDLQLCDDNGVAMTSTHVKGSPYIYTEFEKEAFYLSVPNLTEYFDDNGNAILTSGESITTDHFGIYVTDSDNKEGTKTSETFYCITLPAGTTVKNNGGKLKVTFNGTDRYMSVGTMLKESDLNTYYQHGYAFVTDTKVTYSYQENMSKITSNYDITTEVKRSGYSDTTMQLMLPHQWKYATQEGDTVSIYTSVRGDMHGIWNNHFDTVDTFEGLLPAFALPKSEEFDIDKVTGYLRTLENATKAINPAADAYWEGKNVHPLGMGVLMADQIGNTELRDVFLKRLKERLVDWFTYDGPDDVSYFVYDKHWGTLYYGQSEFGANWGICDHHFTYGYFMFGAAVLATYDEDFLNDYKDMIEILIRDYANPDRNDSEYCSFRAYDLYEGHSWAGGYADNDNGNNQESASESLFSWVGMYLWGVLTENDTYRDAAIFGFTNEIEAIKQYWFDYDEQNWLDEWPYEVVAQIYGGTNFYGTFFGGQPLYCYGIQWLPISEYLTYYGQNQERAAEIYAGLEADTERAANIQIASGEITSIDQYATPDNGWQHITWPFLSQTNPDLAMEKFLANDTKLQTTDQANTYWFIQSMKELGYKSEEVIATGNLSATVYYNEDTKTYTAQVWNPKNTSDTVTFISADGTKTYGTAEIGAQALVGFEIDLEKEFELTQVAAPTIKATGLADGVVTENVTGNVTFGDTQIVELSGVEGATIHYTIDGSVPTASSPVYNEKILVSSDTTVKAIAIQDGYIDSVYAAASFTISGDTVQGNDNLALNKDTTASSGTSVNAVDGDGGSRWESDFTDDEWFQVDLGSVYAINTVVMNWEAAYAAEYEIQVSEDGETWTTVAVENGNSGEDIVTFAAVDARYVKMVGIQRATDYGYSFYEFEVYEALQAEAPVVTPNGGTYTEAQTVTMSTTVKGAEIKYTTDGSEPTEDSATYIEPITVDKSTVVKAATYRKGMELSKVVVSEIIIQGTVAINPTEVEVARDKTVTLKAITDGTVTWSSKNNSIATVDQNGTVTGVKEGTTEIVATLSNGDTATCTINVVAPIYIDNIYLSVESLDMKVHTTSKISAAIYPENTTDDKTITWTSSDNSVATVDKNGIVTSNAVGVAIITATASGVSATCTVTVNPVSVEEMVANEGFNKSLNKTVIISTIYSGEGSQDENVLVDGDLAGDYVSTDWDGERTGEYILLDLGACYNTEGLDQVIVQYKNDAATFGDNYTIQYSTNGIEYVTVAQASDLAFEDTDEGLLVVNIEGAEEKLAATRYVKINIDGHKNWGFQIREAAVLSTEQNAEVIEVGTCENPAALEVVSNELSTLTYTITSGEGQEDYTYNVYLNGELVGINVKAGTYTVKDLSKGKYEVTVYSHYNGAVSDGITKTAQVYENYIDSEYNIAQGCEVTLDPISDVDEGSKDMATLTDLVISGGNDNTVQSLWGTQEATLVIDLGQDYVASDIQQVMLAFKADNTYASAYTIELSSDGTNYETVYTGSDLAYTEIMTSDVDTSSYTQNTVRYVKVNLLDGSYNWGYQIFEVAVIGQGALVESGLTISNKVKIEGHQISTTAENKGGSRVVGSVEPEINGQKVTDWGMVYAITKVGNTNYTVNDEEMCVGSTNAYVASYVATDAGTVNTIMGESQTATYFTRTMLFSAFNQKEFTAEYKVRAYAVLEDGSYVYSMVSDYSVYDIADYLHQNKLMNTFDSHEYLYNTILKVVDSTYEKVEYQWNNSIVDVKDVTTSDLQITGYQMTTSLNNTDNNIGYRVVYQVEPTVNGQETTEVGLVYGLVYGDSPITEADMIYGSENPYVNSYAGTIENGKLNTIMGASETATYYARTMECGVAGSVSTAAYTTSYMVRPYAKLADGSIAYGEVQIFTVYEIADSLYQNDQIRTLDAYNCIYENILSFVNSDYVAGDFNWSGILVK